MNTIKLWSLAIALMLTFPCYAKKHIKVEGRWAQRAKSNTCQYPIQAWVEDSNKDLLLEFSTNLGTVQVTVTNQEGNIVYIQSVETNSMSSTTISLNEEIKNGYVLCVTDGTNTVYGKIFIY